MLAHTYGELNEFTMVERFFVENKPIPEKLRDERCIVILIKNLV